MPAVAVTALRATAPDPPAAEDPLEWLLLTNLPIETPAPVIAKLQWYLCRWRVEVYFQVLKSGCRVPLLQLQTRERTAPALAFSMIIAQAACCT